MIEHWILLSVLIGLCVFLIAGALSPIESLAWWAGWSDEDSPLRKEDRENHAPHDASNLFAVYLAGIDTISGDELTWHVKKLIDGVNSATNEATIVTDVFPYAPSGRPLLAGPRVFLRLWRRLASLKRKARARALTSLINFRNFYQVLISADHRYGPIFNAGAATVILEALTDSGYNLASCPPIVIIGYSGGAQVAIGAAEYLKLATGAPISVISLGGTMASSPGIAALDRLYHLYGSRDRVHKFAALMFSERWAIFPHSQWNLAVAEGRVVRRLIGGMGHDGSGGYLGDNKDSDGEPFLEKTTEAIAAILETERTRLCEKA